MPRFQRVALGLIAALIGVGSEELWNIRNRGVIPPGALPRVRAFVEAGR